MSHTRISEAKSRFAPPPWTEDSPEWLALDRQLAPDHKARLIRAFVQQIDLSELEAAYRGSGSEAHRPDLMLRIALYETLEGHRSPSASRGSRRWGSPPSRPSGRATAPRRAGSTPTRSRSGSCWGYIRRLSTFRPRSPTP